MARQQMLGEEVILFSDDSGVPAPHLIISSHGAYMPRPQIGKQEERGGWMRVRTGLTLYFYGPHRAALEDPTVDGLLAKTPFETKTGGDLVRNYRLSKFQGRHGSKAETYASIRSGIDANRTWVDVQHTALRSLGLDLSVPMATEQRERSIEILRHSLSEDQRKQLDTALGKRRYEKYDVLTLRNRYVDLRSTLDLGLTLRAALDAVPATYDRIHCNFCRSRLIFSPVFTKGYVAQDGEDWERRPDGFRRPHP